MDNIKRQAGYTGGTTADVLALIKAGRENDRLTPGQRRRKRLKRGGARRAQTPPRGVAMIATRKWMLQPVRHCQTGELSVTAFEVVIRLGRPFDIQTGNGRIVSDVREITIAFPGGREFAEAALRDVQMSVRQVHDAGGEDYRVVVPGDVVKSGETVVVEWAEADRAIIDQTARMRASILAPKPDLGDPQGDLNRDMRDLAELEMLDPGKVVRCSGGMAVTSMDYSLAGHPGPLRISRAAGA
jgi:hypothetical protein